MSNPVNVIAQAAPAAATLTDLYTVPALTQSAVGTFVACNQNGSSVLVRVAIALAGAADTRKQYLYYDAVLPPNTTIELISNMTLNTTDVVRVQTDTTNVSFNLFVVETIP